MPPANLFVLIAEVVVCLPALLVPAYFVCFTAPQRKTFWAQSQNWLPLGLASHRR